MKGGNRGSPRKSLRLAPDSFAKGDNMETALSTRLTALALIALLLAGTLAWATVIPPTNAQLTTLVKNTSDVQGSANGSLYLTMTQIASRLRSTASITKAYADVAEKNGSLTEFRQTVLSNKTKFFAKPDKNKLYSAWQLAKSQYGYAQGFGDFSNYILNMPTKQKQAGWNYLSNHTVHDGLVAFAGELNKAANDLDARAAEVKANGGHFLNATFHYSPAMYFNLMSPGDCNGADALAALYGIAALLFPTPVTLGMGVIALLWGGARFYFC